MKELTKYHEISWYNTFLSSDFNVLCWLSLLISLLLSVLSKVDYKILVTFGLIWNFKILGLAMVKVKKLNIADTYLVLGLILWKFPYTFICHLLYPNAGSGIRTHDLKIVSQVLQVCATITSQWGSITHQMSAPFPGLSWCILFTLYVFQKEN